MEQKRGTELISFHVFSFSEHAEAKTTTVHDKKFKKTESSNPEINYIYLEKKLTTKQHSSAKSYITFNVQSWEVRYAKFPYNKFLLFNQ